MFDWLDIETAPRDGSEILACQFIYDELFIEKLIWVDESYGWQRPDWDGTIDPTHWMPLPAPPKPAA